MWISKKKYNELIAQRDDLERVATNAVAQNDRLLDAWHDAIEEMKDIQKLNNRLVKLNDELLVEVKELKAKLAFVTKQRDYYYDLLENTGGVEEKDE